MPPKKSTTSKLAALKRLERKEKKAHKPPSRNPHLSYKAHDLPPHVLTSLTESTPTGSRPTSLRPPDDRERKSTHEDEEVKTVPRLSFLFGSTPYRVRIATAVSISSSGAGLVNSIFACATLTLAADFISIAGLFDEFFIEHFTLKFQPYSRYTGPATTVTGPAVVTAFNVPFGVVSLQHASAAYTTVQALAGNPTARWHSTGDPFMHSWDNVESPKSTVLTSPTGGATQSWCQTSSSAASNYQGFVQFLSPPTPALAVSQVIGYIMVSSSMLFRARV